MSNAIPAGFVEVTWEEFYAYVGPRDIILHTEAHRVVWQTRHQREVGRSFPGWKGEGPKVYLLTRASREELDRERS